ncbi:4-hydroxyphenylpyruvate dioxygenase [uncultured Endozoicomonas sp.]|uniref:4-hydroxyphenylpyruvate dioxygenase n=1 Tax=uncultured Endozoicomonas sp. TaxID=432652 RepID=UPI0026176C78|nr:4-hydroxyphenylpyruvate dioxygenase [uncultured Endozoicomonas sp.]
MNKRRIISDINPMGTDGFEFVEYSAPDSTVLDELFQQLGFVRVAEHRSKKVTLYRQGDVNFIVNRESGSFAEQFAQLHGPCACAFSIRVEDAEYAYQRALRLGGKAGPAHQIGAGELTIPSILGIGGSLIYFVDRYGDNGSIYDNDFEFIDGVDPEPEGLGLSYIDHLTHNVHQGNMNKWASFYEDLFNFKEIRYFDIEGKLTGLKSRAMTSPCGKLRIPINESSDDKSQIEEYLKQYHGEGIQHIALYSNDIYKTVPDMRRSGTDFMPGPPETYYKMLAKRLPWHHENVDTLKSNNILLDGAPTEDGGLLLQIFTKTVIGPIFFEIIQRKGDEGFGEGNFKALFESIERDQIERGVL